MKKYVITYDIGTTGIKTCLIEIEDSPNLASPIFGGIPATGAIARTMTNINNGGRTPIAGIMHAVGTWQTSSL